MPSQEEKTGPGPRPFGIELEDVGGVQVVVVSGELDLETAPALEERLEAALAPNGGPVAIDLSLCEFIDSTGIGLIVRAWQKLDADPDSGNGARFALCGLTEQVRRLLEITGLQQSIRTYESRDDALAGLRDV